MRSAEVFQRRIFGMTAVDRKRAARREGAALGQPGQRRHRAGNFREPLIAIALLRRHRRDRGHQPACIGMQRFCEQAVDVGFLDLPAGIHHDHALGGLRHHAEVVRDQDQPHAQLLLQVEHQREDLRLDGHIECGGRLVRDQQRRPAGQRHRDHRALAHAPRKLMRIFLRAPCRFGDADETQHLHRLLPRRLGAHLAMQPHRLADLVADPDHRVERGHRLLEDHGDAIAANLAHLRFIETEQVGAFEHDLAADDTAGRIGHQAHDRQRADALAAAGFADDRQCLAALDVEGDVVDGTEQAGTGEEHRLQALYLEHVGVGRCSAHQLRCLGSRTSRSASPNRLVPNTARLIAIPGKITSHGAVRTYSAADSDSIRPQDGYGSGMPRPRNDSAASVRMVEPSCAVMSTISGASVFGSTWRTAIRVSLMPMDLAASTKGCSRSASVLARITRATIGTRGMEIAKITFGSEGPRAAVITSASTRSASACMMSVTRWNTRSTQPERYPEASPIATPKIAPSVVEPIPTASEMRAPWMMRANMSRPKASVPNQCWALGGASAWAESTVSGL